MSDLGAPSAHLALADKADAVCHMGALMLSAGTGSYRVKAAMGRVAVALGVDRLDAQVSLNEIIVTTRAGDETVTQVVEVPVPTVNAARIAALLRVSLRARPGLRTQDLQRQLDRIELRRAPYPHAAIVAGAALASLAFAFLNNGHLQECLAAGLGAACGKYVQLLLRRARLNHLAIVTVAAFVAAAVFVLTGWAMHAALPGTSQAVHAAAFTSAILFLVPGFPLLTAALDLTRFDFTAGTARLWYAGLIIFAAGIGAWLVAWGFGLTPAPLAPLDVSQPALLALRLLAGFAGVFGFAVTFNTPWRIALMTSAIGMLANTGRLLIVDEGGHPLVAATAATLAVGLMAGWTSQRFAAPRIIMSVPTVLIMIPGAAAFRALVGLVNGDVLEALTNATSVLSMVVALAAGLALARMLTDPAWTRPAPTWTKMPLTRAQRRLRSYASTTGTRAQPPTG